MDNGSIGNERRDFRRADLDGLLHDEIHVFPLWDRLRERDATRQRWRSGFMQFLQMDLGAIERGNLAGQFAAKAIEEHGFVAGFQAQHIARMMRLRAPQHRRVGIPLVRRNVKAVHGEKE